MKINPTIFREYDIRGVAGESFTSQAIAEYERWYGPFPGITITLEAAEYIGKAYGTYIRREKGKRVIVGREIRPFAKELTESFVKGVLSTGCDVYDADEVLTPLVYFAVAFFGFDGGVNVTGSHNVYFYNGFKMMSRNVRPIFGEKLQTLRQMVENEDFEKGNGTYAIQEIYPAYEKYILAQVKLARSLKIVMDCGNGSSGPFAPQLFKKLGCKVTGMYTEPDATFPNHIPDPEMPNTLVELQKRVVRERADLGVAFDADGDRVGFVDEKGAFIDADKFILILARDILQRHPGKKILYDVKCSRLLQELIPLYGGVPFMHKTGHGPIKDTLHADSDIILAGEVSGHLYFVEDWFRFDDALFGAAQILKLVAAHARPFSSFFEEIPVTVRTPELKLPCADEKKFQVVDTISDFFSSRYKTITIDGVRVLFDEKSWGLIRASNTSGYLTIRIEADTKERLLEIKNIFADKLEEFSEIRDKLNRHEVSSFTGRLGWV
ncbi:MAG: hypothetical protein A2806_02185 [Candidatus Terrybacteria bacterium RIFCSPHIGHO2_01_FULL_48_17]|uniref:Phosphomannomutase n=1 Tax=Candidatus Terrybacteria bacterium RIFCSPHIGHO2_01_FULL_48_17 TaxID=1802362 RepID=A0A1G2PJN2_9BACT|nr:MAG: hypothetical protein A2806_02185 [Candidatus Terrybacteria bacterium RIFCSPHIGHO2_01_FULL_48_17]OHA53558.1 MAG: hypothetical protein A3A30_00140 [Candidatus Terrybacteria bacterium RIFCSPLOWO2_01_FULL_48_14]